MYGVGYDDAPEQDPRRRPEFQFDSDKSECNIVKAEGSFFFCRMTKKCERTPIPICGNEDSPEIPILCDQDANHAPSVHLFHCKICERSVLLSCDQMDLFHRKF